MKYRSIASLILGPFLIALLIAGGLAYAGNLNTSGKCPYGTACVLGHTNTTTFTLQTDGSGDGEVVLPLQSIGSGEIVNEAITSGKMPTNAVTSSQLGANPLGELFFCGESCSSSTCAGGHSVAFLSGDYTASHALAAGACDTLGETSIAAASEIASANNAFKVHGMYCVTDSSGSNGVVLAMTAADAATVPAVTCTIPTGETTCAASTAATTDVAAGAVVAVSIVTTENLSANDFSCRVVVGWRE